MDMEKLISDLRQLLKTYLPNRVNTEALYLIHLQYEILVQDWHNLGEQKHALIEERARLLDQIKKEEHNGWRNYETWAVFNYLSNDFGAYLRVQGIKNELPNELAERLEEWFKSGYSFQTGNRIGTAMYGVLVEAALNRVDWRAIAEAFSE